MAAQSFPTTWPAADAALQSGCKSLCKQLTSTSEALASWDGVRLLQGCVQWRAGQPTVDEFVLAALFDIWIPVALTFLLGLFALRWFLRDFTRLRLYDFQNDADGGRPIDVHRTSSGLGSQPTHTLTVLLVLGLVLAFYVQMTNSIPGASSRSQLPNVAMLLSPFPNLQTGLAAAWAGVPALLAKGQYWRFMTPALLHANVFHLLGNLQVWWGLRMVETWFGSLGYLFIIAFSAFGSSAVSYMFDAATGASVGASGVVCGLMGANMVISRPGECVQSVMSLGIFSIVISLVPLPLKVGHWAHWGGLVSGYIAGSIIATMRVMLGGKKSSM